MKMTITGTEPIVADPSEAGCIISSGFGTYIPGMVIDLAMARNYPFRDEDYSIKELYEKSVPPQDEYDWSVWEYVNGQGGLIDKITEWLSEEVAPEGYVFEWIDGELFMNPLEDSEDEYGE